MLTQIAFILGENNSKTTYREKCCYFIFVTTPLKKTRFCIESDVLRCYD